MRALPNDRAQHLHRRAGQQRHGDLRRLDAEVEADQGPRQLRTACRPAGQLGQGAGKAQAVNQGAQEHQGQALGGGPGPGLTTRPQVKGHHADDGGGDSWLHHPCRHGPASPHAKRQRQRVAGREAAQGGQQVAPAPAGGQHHQQEQQVVRALQHVRGPDAGVVGQQGDR